MIASRIFSTCIICLFIAACDKQEQTTPAKITKVTKVKTAAEKTISKITTLVTRPALKLSIDDVLIKHQGNDDNLFTKNRNSIKINSALFETLSKQQSESSINLSGKLLTDENKLENKDYLNSVDGLQIYIEGSY